MRISLEIKPMPGGYVVEVGLTDGEKVVQKPRSVFVATKAESALKAAEILARFANFLATMARGLAETQPTIERPKIILPN